MKPEPKKLADLITYKHPKLIYSYIKYLWYSNQRTYCLSTLVQLIDHLGQSLIPIAAASSHLCSRYPSREQPEPRRGPEAPCTVSDSR